MKEEKKTDSNSSRPIDLDADEMEALDRLIGSLKKEIVVPKQKGTAKPAHSAAGQN